MTPTALHAIRGDTFRYSFRLSEGWSPAMFAALAFTVRDSIPPSNVHDDLGALAQATLENGGIAIDGDVATITIHPAQTTVWPLARLYWDVQGIVVGSPPAVYTLDFGTLLVQ